MEPAKKDCQIVCLKVRIDAKTVTDWFSFCREVTADYCVHNSAKFGGQGKTVEVNEAKFGKRKYNRERVIEGALVVGDVEMDS